MATRTKLKKNPYEELAEEQAEDSKEFWGEINEKDRDMIQEEANKIANENGAIVKKDNAKSEKLETIVTPSHKTAEIASWNAYPPVHRGVPLTLQNVGKIISLVLLSIVWILFNVIYGMLLFLRWSFMAMVTGTTSAKLFLEYLIKKSGDVH